jgi:hypothetical protein
MENGTATEHTRKEIETKNLKRININKISPLREHQRNPDAPTLSIRIELNTPEQVDYCIHNDILIGKRNYHAEKYMPQYQLKQCYKCYRYGHIAECTRKVTCGKCEQDHPTTECKSTEQKCTNSQSPQPAWHSDCPTANKNYLDSKH